MQMTVNHHRHVPYLQLAQTRYKRAIIQHDAAILRTAVRIGLPSMALPAGDRSSRDEGIMKLLLYFFRNVAMVAAPPNLPVEGNHGDISRSATIEAFHKQEVLALLLTIASNVGDEFKTQDTVILEVLFHLLKGVDVEELFMDNEQRDASHTDQLKSLLRKEANMHRGYAKIAPTRHNRFGTMIWVQRDNARGMSTVSGQDVLKDQEKTLKKMDESKKWNKPKQRSKDSEQSSDRFDLPVPLSEAANRHLRSFVEEFLDSSFNPLFNHIRKAIEREADRVLEAHAQQYFYLVSWFLEVERARRRRKAEADKKKKKVQDKIITDFEADSFALVASVLNQETFVLLNRFMQDRLDMKAWRDVHAGMRCFTQILLIVQDMAESPVEEDQDIAENIQNRIFYEETTHDRIIAILRTYQDQGFGYLDSCTELSHVFLRMLERYSRENVDLQVRSRRRARKSKKAAAARQHGETDDVNDADNASEMEEIAEAQRVSKERKFDFTRFSAKFMTQGCVDAFVAFTKYYSDLNAEQLKRAHRFFYRVAFKQELSVMLFRLDIIVLFYRIIKGPEGLDRAASMFKEWDELVRQLLKKLVKKMQQRPELAVELLFSKIRSTVFYLEYGYEEQTVASKPRAPATLEVKGEMTREEQIGVVVAALYDEKIEHVDWVAKVLSEAGSERQSWEAEAAATRAEAGENLDPENEDSEVKPPTIGKHRTRMTCEANVLIRGVSVVNADTPDRATAMFKDAKLRLLMTLSDFERLGVDDEPGATWIVPSSLTARELQETHDCIDRHRRDPVMQYGDTGEFDAAEMLRRKPNTAARQKRADYDDDSSSEGARTDDGEEGFLFPPGGPVDDKTRRSDALQKLKKKRRRRRRDSGTGNDEEATPDDDDEAREQKRKARLAADLEKRLKIKSAEFVGDSDSDSEADAVFFRKEEERRKGQAGRVMEALKAGRVQKKAEGVQGVAKKEAKRKGGILHDARGSSKKRRSSSPPPASSSEEEADADIMFLDGGGGDDAAAAAASSSSSPPPPPSPSRAKRELSASSSADHAMTETPLSSPHVPSSSFPSQIKAQGVSSRDHGLRDKVQAVTLASGEEGEEADSANGSEDDDDDDDDLIITRPSGRRRKP
ncbi:MAG: hypothetical protein Q9191_001304, partial [Dirinaria sp. TL-2023a]